jgi:hypothetical protein
MPDLTCREDGSAVPQFQGCGDPGGFGHRNPLGEGKPVISKDAKSQAKFIHGINLVVAKNYSDNLREEVKKGMREKASQGIYPGHAPFGYRNNKADRTIEVDPVDSPMVIQTMELYATGAHTLSTLRDMLKTNFGKTMSRGNIHLILKNRFYVGTSNGSVKLTTVPIRCSLLRRHSPEFRLCSPGTIVPSTPSGRLRFAV